MKKRLLCVMIILSVISGAVFADTDLSTSKTNGSTAGIFSEDQDNYLDTTGFKDIESNKLFLNLGSPSEWDSAFEIGTANIWDSFYLGAMLYIDKLGSEGNIDGSGTALEDAATSIDYIESPTGTVTSKKTVSSADEDETYSFENRGKVLVGVGNIGIGLMASMDDDLRSGTLYWTGSTVDSRQSSMVTVEDTDGTLISETSTDYSGGFSNSKDDSFGLEVGTTIDAMNGIDVKVGITPVYPY
jgi:hypothetical protein